MRITKWELRFSMVIVASLLLLLLVIVSWASAQREEALPVYWDAPGFVLTDQGGRTVNARDLTGKIWVADFIYTNCRESCPLLTARMKLLQERLRVEALLGKEVFLISFTVDPLRDTRDILKSYAVQIQAEPDAWRFLTGPEPILARLIVEDFRLGRFKAEPETEGEQPGDESVIVHSNRFVVVDGQGRIRAFLDGLEPDAVERMMATVRRLRSESGK